MICLRRYRANKDEGDPIPELTVLALDQNGEAAGFVQTASDGSYLIDDLPLGEYRVMVEYYGKSLEYYDVILDAMNPFAENLDFAVEDDAVVTLRTNLDRSLLAEEMVSRFVDQDLFTLSLYLSESMDARLSLLDLSGRVLWQTQQHLTIGQSRFQERIPGLSSGIYVLQIRTSSGLAVSKKIIKY